MNYTLAELKTPEKGDWYVYYSCRDPATGKLKPFKRTFDLNRIKDKKERIRKGKIAASELNQMLKEGYSPFADHIVNDFEGLTLPSVMQEVIKIKTESIRERSAQHYKFAKNLFSAFLEKKGISEILPQHFTRTLAQSYSDYLLVEKKYSGKSHNNQVGNMNMFFNAMVDREVVPVNPFKKIKKKRENRGRIISYSEVQKKTIREYVDRNNHPMRMFIRWIYYCFIRPKEIMMLQVKFIDFENGMIWVPANVSKNNKDGLIPIRKDFLKLVVAEYKHLDPEWFIAGQKLIPGPIAVHRNRATHSHKIMLKDISISNDHVLYDWKHTGARDFILSGGNPVDLQGRMRHHSLDETMTYLTSLGVSIGMKSNLDAWNF